MEEASQKIKTLLAKARDEKIELSKLEVIKKRDEYFRINRKYKIIITIMFLCYIYGRLKHLIDFNKVFSTYG
jgi:hypothetical protein